MFILFKSWRSFHRPGTFHGVAIWMDFHLTEKLTITTGLQQVRHPNHLLVENSLCRFNPPLIYFLSQNQGVADWTSKLNWVRHTKQGVYFMQSPTKIQDETLVKNNVPDIRYAVSFEPNSGEIDFNFQLRTS